MNFNKKYDIVIIGAGHAGCEAALSASRMGANVLLTTISTPNIALMSCNPAIGGLGKGNLVKDMDALGGEMGKNIDETGIQFRILNKRKGPAVWSSRAQADKYLYKERMRSIVMETVPDVKQVIVTNILLENNKITGVETSCGQTFYTEKVIIAAGTFINGFIYVGTNKIAAGRMYEPSSVALSQSLIKAGLTPIRLKTDTPPRINIDSIDTSELETLETDEEIYTFCPDSSQVKLPQISCYITHTNEKTHEIVRSGIKNTLLYNSENSWLGPRYCPSIEDKIIHFTDKKEHKMVIEPEGLETKECHLNGFSTSLPANIQLEACRSIKGLEKCEFTRPGYAVQYDVYDPRNLYSTYESKQINGLYIAGQPNGTSGYEEAAVQGFLAGVNAVLSIDKKDPFILGRDQSYLGVLTNDLTTKGITEPYRMFSSRAEFRIMLREDNTEDRLIEYGYNLGLISKTRYDRYLEDNRKIEAEIDFLKRTKIKPDNEILKKYNVTISQTINAYDALKHPEISHKIVAEISNSHLNKRLGHKLETRIKYAGYIEKQKKEIEKYKELAAIKIPDNFSFDNIAGLRIEYSEQLKKIRPHTLGEIANLPSFSYNVIDILAVHINKINKQNQNVPRETSQNNRTKE